MSRREFFRQSAAILAGLGLANLSHLPLLASLTDDASSTITPLPTRPLGRTGAQVGLVSLGGEGVLRTTGRMREAVPVIRAALDAGITYCDTAPAYQQSQDYYGEALGDRRRAIFLATKTHDRSRDGSLRLLDQSLRRLRTDHVDLWQLHDLRTPDDLDAIFGKGGAIEALETARAHGLTRFVGLTGHYDPRVLVEAMRRYSFDTALVALNPADRQRLSFIETVLPEAAARGVGVIGMKILARGALLAPEGPLALEEAIAYALSLPIATVIIGYSSPAEVRAAVEIAHRFEPLSPDLMQAIERRTAPYAAHATFYKKPA